MTTPKKKLSQEEEDPYSSDDPRLVLCGNSSVPTAGPFNKKFVGATLPQGVDLREVLRKKFSWKSFPELEAYLVEHRQQYLRYSNSLNYTKAQKQYNNKLTQGLLELAGRQGYVFEGFTFAMVRDRIRCFYKSFVQATKKKTKRNGTAKQQRGRTVSL